MMDEEPSFFTKKKVTIVGMGLMGSSLALALRSAGANITGIDTDTSVVAAVLEQGIVAVASRNVHDLADADVIILATPVGAILTLLAALPELHPGPALVFDLGSTKSTITAAMNRLPERFEAFGGHPMCGKEKLGPQEADGTLFRGMPFVLVETARTTATARKAGGAIASCVGAVPMWLDAENHDRMVAATSHVPYLLANALASVTPPDAAPLAQSGWKSTARLAHTPTSMMLDILNTNRENILDMLVRYQEQLSMTEQYLRAGNLAALRAQLDLGTTRYLEMMQRGEI